MWLPESNRGYKLLMSMGWKEDSGLGPTGSGRVEPISTAFKTDHTGVGVQPTAKLARVTRFPAHNEHQHQQCMQERLACKRKQDLHQQQRAFSQVGRKARKLQDKQRDRALGREPYGAGLDGYEDFLQ